MAELEQLVVQLRTGLRFAFVAKCTERAIAASAAQYPDETNSLPSFKQALEVFWRQAIQEDVDYARDAEAIRHAATEPIPAGAAEGLDEERYPTTIVCVAQTIGLGMGALKRPTEAVDYVCESAESAASALASAYKDEDRVWMEEQEWQKRALELLLNHGDQPVTRDMFDSLPEYDQGEIADPEYP